MRKTLGDIFKILAIAAACLVVGFLVLLKVLAVLPFRD